MIEAQQKNINRSPESRMRTIAIDSGVSQFRRMMNEDDAGRETKRSRDGRRRRLIVSEQNVGISGGHS